MWEFSIVISREHVELSLLVWNKIEELMKSYKGVTIKNSKESITIILSLPKKHKLIAQAELKDIVAEAIVLYFKARYIHDNIRVPIDNETLKTALYKALAVFDKKTDIDFVKKEMHFTKKLHIDSFYEFRLIELRLRWQEICDLMQENINYLLLTDSFNELVKYLIKTTEPEFESVFVYLNDENVIIRDKEGHKLCEPIMASKEDIDILVISELIYLAPKNIYLKFNQGENKVLADKINDIFCEKVCNKC